MSFPFIPPQTLHYSNITVNGGMLTGGGNLGSDVTLGLVPATGPEVLAGLRDDVPVTPLGFASISASISAVLYAASSIVPSIVTPSYAVSVSDQQCNTLAALGNDGSILTPFFQLTAQGGGEFKIKDRYRNVVVQIGNAGLGVGALHSVNTVALSTVTIAEGGSDGFVFKVVDGNGYVTAAISEAGVFYGNGFNTPRASGGDYSTDELLERSAAAVAKMNAWRLGTNTTTTVPGWTYNHTIVYGQSLGGGKEGWPSKTLTGRSDVLMVGQAVRPGGDEHTAAAVPLGDANFHQAVATVQDPTTGLALTAMQQAALSPGDLSNGEEVGVAGMQFARRLFLQSLASLSDPRMFVVSNVCVGGETLEALSKGASPNLYQRLPDIANAAKTASTAASGTYGIAAIWGLQGEYNYNPTFGGTQDKDTYKALWLALFNNIVADLATGIAGQADPPAMILYQTSGNWVKDAANLSISQGQLELCQENPGWFMATPSYPFTDKNGHLDPNGYRWMAMYFGRVHHEVVVLRRQWRPLSPLQATFRGATVAVDFWVPAPPLQFQPVLVGSLSFIQTNYGFAITDAVGTPTISAITIVGDATVQIICSRPLVGPVYFEAGTLAAGFGNTNLCDSDTTVVPFDYNYVPGSGDYVAADILSLVNSPYPMPNWCVLTRVEASAD